MRLAATFTVDVFEPDPVTTGHGEVEMAKVTVEKTFSGGLEGKGTVEMLTTFALGGRGYVAVEWIEGAIGGRIGGFALVHCATDDGGDLWGVWRVVPGSGQGALAGIRGEATIDVDADGTHRFNLDYHLEPTLG